MSALKVPVLYVYSDSDPSQRNAVAAFAKAPPNPLNRQVKVSANHIETVNAGREATLAWIRDASKSP